MLSVWSYDYNVIILNVGVLLLFYGGWYGSGVTSMMLLLVSTSKEQLVDYYGFSVLINQITLTGLSVFYCLYGGFPLFKNYKKRHT